MDKVEAHEEMEWMEGGEGNVEMMWLQLINANFFLQTKKK